MKNKVMLILSTARNSPKGTERAIELASLGGKELVLLFTLDTDMGEKVARQLTDSGFLGSTPSEQLFQAFHEEQKIQAETELQEIEKRAGERGVTARVRIEEGPFVETCLKVIKEEDVGMVVITRRRRMKLSRLLFGSPVEQLKKNASCPIEIVDG